MYKSFTKPYGIRYIGNGLSTESNLDSWRHRRSILNQGFNRKYILLNLRFNYLFIKKLYY